MHFIEDGKGTHPYKDGDGKQEGERVCVPESSTCIITSGIFPKKRKT